MNLRNMEKWIRYLETNVLDPIRTMDTTMRHGDLSPDYGRWFIKVTLAQSKG